MTRGRLPVIVCLDPAGPLFSLADPLNRVDFTDADHVEVLATDIVFLGFEQPVGHGNVISYTVGLNLLIIMTVS